MVFESRMTATAGTFTSAERESPVQEKYAGLKDAVSSGPSHVTD